jgi:hypothetical protein
VIGSHHHAEHGQTSRYDRRTQAKRKIFVNGEIWNAHSNIPLSLADKAVTEKLQGFFLTVKKVPTISDSRRKN